MHSTKIFLQSINNLMRDSKKTTNKGNIKKQIIKKWQYSFNNSEEQ